LLIYIEVSNGYPMVGI